MWGNVDYADPDYYAPSPRAIDILGEVPKEDGRYHLQDEWFAHLEEANPETAKKTAEIKLATSEEKFRQMLVQSPLSIEIHNPAGYIEEANPAWMDLWGVKDEEELEALKASWCILEDEQITSLGMMPLVEQAFRGERVVLPELARQADLVFIDEIGKMECLSPAFRRTVLHVLELPNAVIGSIALKGDRFVEEITAKYGHRQDVLIDAFERAGWPIRRNRASMFVWARIPECVQHLG